MCFSLPVVSLACVFDSEDGVCWYLNMYIAILKTTPRQNIAESLVSCSHVLRNFFRFPLIMQNSTSLCSRVVSFQLIWNTG